MKGGKRLDKYLLIQILKRSTGAAVKLELKAGGVFFFKITGYGNDYLTGYDDEGTNLKINFDDILNVSL